MGDIVYTKIGRSKYIVLAWQSKRSWTTASLLAQGEGDRINTLPVMRPDGSIHLPIDVCNSLIEPGNEPLIGVYMRVADPVGRVKNGWQWGRAGCTKIYLFGNQNGAGFLCRKSLYDKGVVRPNEKFKLTDVFSASDLNGMYKNLRAGLQKLMKKDAPG